MPHHAQGLRFLPGDPLTVTCDFNSSERDQPTPAGSGSKVRVTLGGPIRRRHAELLAGAVMQGPQLCSAKCTDSIADVSLFSMQNEMCNMYMMVTSEIPYFMSCGNR